MKKLIPVIVVVALCVSLISCLTTDASSTTSTSDSSSATPAKTSKEPRTIVLKGIEFYDGELVYSEEEYNKFDVWYVKGFSNDEDDPVLFEIGFVGGDYPHIGFILRTGENVGEIAFHDIEGLNHVWYWDEYNYIFEIEPDGTGTYYDLSYSEVEIYKCVIRE